MKKTKVKIISGEHSGKLGYIDYYHWDVACFCFVVLPDEIVCVYLKDVKPIDF